MVDRRATTHRGIPWYSVVSLITPRYSVHSPWYAHRGVVSSKNKPIPPMGMLFAPFYFAKVPFSPLYPAKAPHFTLLKCFPSFHFTALKRYRFTRLKRFPLCAVEAPLRCLPTLPLFTIVRKYVRKCGFFCFFCGVGQNTIFWCLEFSKRKKKVTQRKKKNKTSCLLNNIYKHMINKNTNQTQHIV